MDLSDEANMNEYFRQKKSNPYKLNSYFEIAKLKK